MDQNYQPYQTEQFYQAPPVQKNASYFRAKARAALKHCYGYAILAFLLASLLGGVVSGGTSFSFGSTSNGDINVNFSTVEIEQLAEANSAKEAWDIFLEILPEEARFVVTVVAVVIIVALIFALAFSVFVGSPVKLGYQRYCLNVMDGNGKDLSVLFRYFKRGIYGKSIGLNILYRLLMFAISLPLLGVMLAVVFPAALKVILEGGNSPTNESIISLILSVMLLIAVAIATSIVEIVLQYRYAYCFMILAEYPEMRVIDAFRNSASLMKGKKFRLFCLQFSFIGWILLAACCTCGIGMLFLSPYIQTANAAFYDDITNRAAARETEFPSLNPDDYVVE